MSGVSFEYGLSLPTAPEPPAAPSAGSTPASQENTDLAAASGYLGFGLLTPFRRDQRSDFVAGGGVALVKSCIEQIIGTVSDSEDGALSGELPWRTEFGSKLTKLRHKKNTLGRGALAHAWAVEDISRWEPRARVTDVRVERSVDKRSLRLRIRFDVIRRNVAGNDVLLAGQEASVEL